MKIRYVVVLGFALFAAPQPAAAQSMLAWAFGDTLLKKLLPDEWLENSEFFKSLSFVQELTGNVRDTAVFAREAVQVSKNVKAIIDDPAQFALYSTRGWVDSFPQVYHILANVEQTRLSMHEATHPEDLSDYDPYAYVSAFDALKNMTDSRYATLAAALDIHGVNDGEDQTMQAITVAHEAALNNLRDLADRLNSTGVSPLQANVDTALATTISAEAAQRAAGILHDMQKLAALKVVNGVAGEHEDRKRQLAEEIATVNMNAPSWRLIHLHKRSKGDSE